MSTDDDPTQKVPPIRDSADEKLTSGGGFLVVIMGVVLTALGIGAAVWMQWCNPS